MHWERKKHFNFREGSMLYFIIEKEASNGMVPNFFYITEDNGELIIPLFLSRLHGINYLRANSFDELTLVRITDDRLAPHRRTCEVLPDGGVSSYEYPKCMVVIGLQDIEDKRRVILNDRHTYYLKEAFFNEDLIQKDVKEVFDTVLGADDYQSMMSYEALTDEQLEALFNNAYMDTVQC
jgi:hypothetical protein